MMQTFQEIRKQVRNALTEDGAELRDVLLSIIDRVEQASEQYNAEGLAEEVEKTLREELNKSVDERVAAEVAEQVAKRVQSVRNSFTPAGERLSAKVQNEISAAIFKSSDKNSVVDNVNAVLTKNAINGLSFEEVIDFAIVDNWGDTDPLFAQHKRVPFTKFFYTTDDLTVASTRAKQWDSTNIENIEKEIQQLNVNAKTLSPDYIYKIQEIAFKDLDSIEKTGKSSMLLRWLNEELDRQIVNTIMYQILRGGADISTFETIGGKTTSDAFTRVSSYEAANINLYNVANAFAQIERKVGQKVVAVMSPLNLLKLQAFTYGQGGSTDVRGRDVVAAALGVDEIFTYSWLDDVIVGYVPDEYWVVEDGALSVAYPVYMKNKQNFQKERNIAGGIHGLYSSVVVKIA